MELDTLVAAVAVLEVLEEMEDLAETVLVEAEELVLHHH
jgi:hypothetical protein